MIIRELKRNFNIILTLALAAAAAACGKNEVTPAGNEAPVEITYETAPVTRGVDKFADGNVFASVAYYLGEGLSWSGRSDSDTPSLFLGTETAGVTVGVTVSHSGNAWKSEGRKYYWPKKGRLTFFAWTLNSGSLNFSSGSAAQVSCSPTEGITLENYDIKLEGNTDFMVAKVAEDKNANEKQYVATSLVDCGVPTLFRHMLSGLRITARTKDDYSSVKQIYIRSVRLTGMLQQASYRQSSWDAAATPKWSEVNVWTPVTDASGSRMLWDVDFYKYAGTEDSKTAAGLEVNTFDENAPVEVPGSQTYYLPETFSGEETVEIVYQIKNLANNVVEYVKTDKKLKDIVGSEFVWGRKYTVNLIFGLDEILWDPAVEDWTAEDRTVDIPEN